MHSYQPNDSEALVSCTINDGSWITENTAIIVTHGIGNQLPLATIDQFARGLVKQLVHSFPNDITLHHELVNKSADNNSDTWFDNVLRIRKAGSDCYIDIYEYYWANYTEDRAGWSDINNWLQGVVRGAKVFYKKNEEIGKANKDESIFFNSKTGKFNVHTYRFFLATISRVLTGIDFITTGLLKLISHIPLLGNVAAFLLDKMLNSQMHSLTNVLGDIVIYNVSDPKSKFYGVKRCILDGAVKAFRFLIERTHKDGTLFYPSIIIAGHSLGTQVAYDAINKINLLINEGIITTYDTEGICKSNRSACITDQIKGFITFGSPLDKIVFFLRENIPDTEYIRQQLLDNYHGFKQKELNSIINNKNYVRAGSELKRLLEEIKWRNYWDGKDYVSGSLDYFTGLTNIHCDFKAGRTGFTHSYYWDCDAFFVDIINHYLINK